MTLSNRGFILNVTTNECKKIKRELTISPECKGPFVSDKVIPLYREISDNEIIVPLYYLKDSTNVSIDFPKINKNSFQEPSEKIILRKNQEECYSNIIESIRKKETSSGIIQLETGMGKTIISIKVILDSKLKTLIIVPKIELLNQWKKELEKWGPKDLKIGIFQGKNRPDKDCHVVIGMLHTVSMKEEVSYLDFLDYDLGIIDEVHNVGSSVFSNLMFKLRPRYLFGLTATLKRNDSMEKIIYFFLGSSIYDSESSKNMKQSTKLKVVKYLGNSSVVKYLRDGTVAVSTMITNIAKDKERNDLIVKEIKILLEKEEREILVVSDRITQLRYINSSLGDDISGLFIGKMKSEELDLSKTKRVILGTYALVSEGFNLPKLNCIVFATPRKSVTQAIGRIFRQKHFSIDPYILDICDDFSIFKYQFYARKKIYRSQISSLESVNETKDTSLEDYDDEVCLILD